MSTTVESGRILLFSSTTRVRFLLPPRARDPEIALALLVSEATMAQRLVRAKRKIVNAGIPYRVPTTGDLPGRHAAHRYRDAILLAPTEPERRFLERRLAEVVSR